MKLSYKVMSTVALAACVSTVAMATPSMSAAVNIDAVVVEVDGIQIVVPMEKYNIASIGFDQALYNYLKNGKEAPAISALRAGGKYIDPTELNMMFMLNDSDITKAVAGADEVVTNEMKEFKGFDIFGTPNLVDVIPPVEEEPEVIDVNIVTEVMKIATPTVDFGTTREQITATLGSKVIGTLGGKKEAELDISWDSVNFVNDKAGTYEFIGTISAPPGSTVVVPADKATVKVNVTVRAARSLAVMEVSEITPTTVEVELTQPPAIPLTLATDKDRFEIIANGKVNAVKDITHLSGKKYSLTLTDSLDTTEGNLTVNGQAPMAKSVKGSLFDYDFKAPSVVYTTVKGEKSIVVKFDEKMSETGTALAKFKVVTAEQPETNLLTDGRAELSADGTEVTLTLGGANKLTTGSYLVKLTNVEDLSGQLISVDKEITPTAEQLTGAPTILETVYDNNKGELTLTFDKKPTSINITKLSVKGITLTTEERMVISDKVVTIILSQTTKAALNESAGTLVLTSAANAYSDGINKTAGETVPMKRVFETMISTAIYGQDKNILTLTFDQAVRIADLAKIKINDNPNVDEPVVLTGATKVDGTVYLPADLLIAKSIWTFTLSDVEASKLEAMGSKQDLRAYLDAGALMNNDGYDIRNIVIDYAKGGKVTYNGDKEKPFIKGITFDYAGIGSALTIELNEKATVKGELTLATSATGDGNEVTVPFSSVNTDSKNKITIDYATLTPDSVAKLKNMYESGKSIRVFFAEDAITDDNGLKNDAVSFANGIILKYVDKVKPTLASLVATANTKAIGDTIVVTFSEPVQRAEAEKEENYQVLVNGEEIPVTTYTSILEADDKSVKITLDPTTENILKDDSVVVTVAGDKIVDRAGVKLAQSTINGTVISKVKAQTTPATAVFTDTKTVKLTFTNSLLASTVIAKDFTVAKGTIATATVGTTTATSNEVILTLSEQAAVGTLTVKPSLSFMIKDDVGNDLTTVVLGGIGIATTNQLSKGAKPTNVKLNVATGITTNIGIDREYSIDGGITWLSGAAVSPTLTVEDLDPQKDFQVRTKEVGTMLASESFILNIGEAPTAPTDVTLDVATGETTNTESTQEYSVDGGVSWKKFSDTNQILSADILAKLNATNDFLVRTAVDESTLVGDSFKIDIKGAPGAPTNVKLNVATGATTNTTLTEEYSVDGGKTWVKFNSANETLSADVLADLTATNDFLVRIAAVGTTLASKPQTLDIVVAPTPNITLNVATGATNRTASTQEYSVDGGVTWMRFSSVNETLSADVLDDLTATNGFLVRTVAATPLTLVGIPQVIQIIKAPDAPPITFGVASGENKVKLQGTTTAMEYKVGDGNWTSATANIEIEALAGAIIEVRVKATATTLAGVSQSLSVALANITPVAAPNVVSEAASTTVGATKLTGLTASTVYEYVVNSSIATLSATDTAWTNAKTFTTGAGESTVDNLSLVGTGTHIHVRIKATSLKPASVAKDIVLLTKLSNDARLVSVAGVTDAIPGAQTGVDPSTAIVWETTVVNAKENLVAADIQAAAGTTVSIYSDANFTTASAALALAVGTTTAYIKVTAADSTVKYYAVTITRPS